MLSLMISPSSLQKIQQMRHMLSHVKITWNPPTRNPTKHEFKNCPRIELTYLTAEWDPHSTTFQEQEEAFMDNKGKLHEWDKKRMSVDIYISMFDTVLASTLTECHDDPAHDLSLALHDGYKSQVLYQVLAQRKESQSPYDLAKRWNIGLETPSKNSLRQPRGTKDSPQSFIVSTV